MPLTQQARSAYRALLREHPRRNLLQSTSTSATSPSTTPLHNRLREMFRNGGDETTSPAKKGGELSEAEQQRALQRIQEVQQLAQYVKAQRTYTSLLELYFPGMSMDEEERIRLTARKVGWDLPVTGSGGQ